MPGWHCSAFLGGKVVGYIPKAPLVGAGGVKEPLSAPMVRLKNPHLPQCQGTRATEGKRRASHAVSYPEDM